MIERGGATLLIARAPDPDRPLQPRLLRGRRRPRAALALRLDDRGRLPADHRARRLLRHPARGPQPHRPAGPRQRRRAAGAAAGRPLDRAPPGGAAGDRDDQPTALDPEAEDGRRSRSTLPAASTRLDPHHVARRRRSGADESGRQKREQAAVDPADEGGAGLVGAEAEDARARGARVRTILRGVLRKKVARGDGVDGEAGGPAGPTLPPTSMPRPASVCGRRRAAVAA